MTMSERDEIASLFPQTVHSKYRQRHRLLSRKMQFASLSVEMNCKQAGEESTYRHKILKKALYFFQHVIKIKWLGKKIICPGLACNFFRLVVG